MDETRNIAKFLNIDSIGAAQAHEMELVIKALQNRFKGRSRSIIYLIGLNPLRALGNDPWLNNLLSLCGLTNAMQDSVAPYPQISMAQILRAQPNIVIVGTKLSQHEVQNTLAPPIIDLDTQILVANPDKLHRFTPRALDELAQLCTATYTTN
jgi:vitamin B12 transport system substrate-binding protein